LISGVPLFHFKRDFYKKSKKISREAAKSQRSAEKKSLRNLCAFAPLRALFFGSGLSALGSSCSQYAISTHSCHKRSKETPGNTKKFVQIRVNQWLIQEVFDSEIVLNPA